MVPSTMVRGFPSTDIGVLVLWILNWVTCTIASLAFLLGGLISLSWLKHWKNVQHLKQLPGEQICIPYLKIWIMNRYCSNPNSPAGYEGLFFSTVVGAYECFKRTGIRVMYIGLRPLVEVYRADYAETLLTSNKILKKGHQYDFLHSWLGTGLLTSTGTKWKTRRRMLTPAFHFRILEDFTSTINVQSMVLVDILGKESQRSNGFDVVPKVTMCTLDIVCETIMGTQINAQIDAESSYVKAVNRLGELFVHRLTKPRLWVDFIFRASTLGKEYYKCLDILHSFTRKVITERKTKLKKEIDAGILSLSETVDEETGFKIRRPFLDRVLIEHLKDPTLINEEGIREEVDTLMFAGHDTTAMGISWTLFLIGHNPEEQDKIHEELDSIFGDDQERHVTQDDLKDMKYLECAIKESQRIYPSVPFIARTCEEPFEIAGVTLKSGTTLQISNYALNRNSDVFPKPEEFHPERFLPENSRGRNPFAFLPFSAGPRNCVGQRFAMSEEKIILANILRRYRVQSVEQRDKIVLVAEIVLRSRDGLRIKFIPRATT